MTAGKISGREFLDNRVNRILELVIEGVPSAAFSWKTFFSFWWTDNFKSQTCTFLKAGGGEGEGTLFPIVLPCAEPHASERQTWAFFFPNSLPWDICWVTAVDIPTNKYRKTAWNTRSPPDGTAGSGPSNSHMRCEGPFTVEPGAVLNAKNKKSPSPACTLDIDLHLQGGKM